MSPRTDRTRAMSRERGAALVALAVVAVLVVTLAVTLTGRSSAVVGTGERLPLESSLYSATTGEVVVPGATITLQVGEPVQEIDSAHVAVDDDRVSSDAPVRPAEGARLVPVSWSLRPTGNVRRSSEDDRAATVRLVAGDRTIRLARGTTAELVEDAAAWVVAVDGVEDLADLTVEVEYDGVTQVLDGASGEVDAGAAAGLYEPALSVPTGCEEVADRCQLAARGTAPWRPVRGEATFVAGPVELQGYDEDLGWPTEGRRWARVPVQLFGARTVESSSGDSREVSRIGATTLTLDGERSRHSTGLGDVDPYDSANGSVVVEVDADGTLGDLRVRRDLELTDGRSPETVRVDATIPLDSRQ